MTGTPSAWYLRADASDPTIAAAIEAGIARVRTRHGEGVVAIDQSSPLLTVRQGERMWERRQTVTVPVTDDVRAALSDHVTIPEGAETLDVVLAVPTVRINAARQVATPTADAKSAGSAKSAAATQGALPAHLAQFLTD